MIDFLQDILNSPRNGFHAFNSCATVEAAFGIYELQFEMRNGFVSM